MVGLENVCKVRSARFVAAATLKVFPLQLSKRLKDPTATNMEECNEYVARAETTAGGVFAHQSEHALFQIVTPKATIRLSHGR